MNDEPCITDEVLDVAAAKSDAAEVSVLRRLVGLPVRGRTGVRIDRTLEALGLRRGIPTPSLKAG